MSEAVPCAASGMVVVVLCLCLVCSSLTFFDLMSLSLRPVRLRTWGMFFEY